MKVVSTTIAGPGSETTIAKALDSVAPFVDRAIVLANGGDDAVQKIRAAIQAGTVPVDFGQFTWTNDFSAARNRALDAACEDGADWCLWIDTDEWIECFPPDSAPMMPAALRDQLASPQHGALMMLHASGEYSQPRLIRLPTAQRWSGRTHECFPSFKVGQGQVMGLRFNEGAKTADQLAAKFRRDEAILLEEVEKDQNDARSWFYLAETRRNLGDVSGAIRAYDRRAMLKGWNEESAWACYRAAVCLAELEHYEPAIERCCTGLGLHAGIAELAWMAGWCNYKLQRWEQAIRWSQMAIVGGEYKGAVQIGERIGFRYPPALYEAPYGVLKHAARELGKEWLHRLAHEEFGRALQAREKAGMP